MFECDVFVVGCGPAGASLAYFLAQQNIKVIVAEKKKTLDRPVRCAGFVPVNIAGLFDFKIAGINNQTQYLETYAAQNPSEKFALISKTIAPGFILDRDIFVRHLASKFSSAGGKLLKGTKVISIQKGRDGFILVLADLKSGNHLMVKARIIAGADGPLSLTGRTAGSVNKSFMTAMQQNPDVIQKSTDCSKVFFSPYISCGYGWLFPKTTSINLGVGTGNTGRVACNPGLCENHRASGTDNISKVTANPDLSGDCSASGISVKRKTIRPEKKAQNPDISIKEILALFIRHLEFSGVFAGNSSPCQYKYNVDNHYLFSDDNAAGIRKPPPLETNNQQAQIVTGLIPDSGLVENPGLKEGYILCGDAAGLCNPVTGAGIYNAVYSAKLTSETIVKSLSLNDLNIIQEIKEIYISQFGISINRALKKKLLQKSNWPGLMPKIKNHDILDHNMDSVEFSDLVRRTWVGFKDYWH